MRSHLYLCASAALSATAHALSNPAITAKPAHNNPQRRAAAAAPDPLIRAIDASPTRTVKRRGIISDVAGDVSGALSSLGTNVPSYVASGVPQWWENLPTGTQVASSLGLDDDDLQATPTAVQNFPPYANWTDRGWNVRFHGNIYRQPNTSVDDLNDRANDFLIGMDIEDLPPDQQAQARNVTAEIFIVQDGNAPPPVFTLSPAPNTGGDGEPGGGGGVTPQNGAGQQTVAYPFDVTIEGDYDNFVPIVSTGLAPGNETNQIQRLNVVTNGTDLGNATAYLVPNQGLTIISDIDDILRITKIWDPKEIIANTFARPYVPWLNMPDIYRNWSESLNISDSQTHFHYLTTLPEQVTRNYEEFIFANYPGGSFDTRPLNFSDVSATLSIRRFLLDKIFQTFPHRKFILVADTSNSDVMKAYPALATDYPGQVQCIFLRNTSATDDSDYFPYDTSGFQGLNQNMYMFFNTPDDLMHLDIANGQCYNNSVPQSVSFGYQGLPFGLSTGDGGGSGASGNGSSQGAAASLRGDTTTLCSSVLSAAALALFLIWA
ncbi:MAG: hypothetical protein Q9162_004226 [Coniocarpon cinnabarinum]